LSRKSREIEPAARDGSIVVRPGGTIDPGAIADVILARLAIPEKEIRRRKLFVFVIAFVVSSILAATLIVIRPPVSATLRVSQANAFTELSITGSRVNQPLRGEAQLRTLDIKLLPNSKQSVTRLLEIIVPVPASRCMGLAEQTGGSCGSEHLPRPLPGGSLDITWTQTAGLTLFTNHMNSLTIRGDATNYATLLIATPAVTVASFSCLVPGESFVMTVSGRPFDLQPSCVESTTRELHLLFKYGVLPPVSLRAPIKMSVVGVCGR
jgi:DNA-binding transcriptional regulator YdaS (Cro superfamily)